MKNCSTSVTFKTHMYECVYSVKLLRFLLLQVLSLWHSKKLKSLAWKQTLIFFYELKLFIAHNSIHTQKKNSSVTFIDLSSGVRTKTLKLAALLANPNHVGTSSLFSLFSCCHTLTSASSQPHC